MREQQYARAQSQEVPLGRLLIEHADELLEHWYGRWRSEGAPHHEVSEAALKDLVPVQLRLIADALCNDSYRTEPPSRLWKLAERLAPEERVPQHIPIEEVVLEYWLLLSTVRDWIEERRLVVAFAEYTYLFEAIFELVAESVRRYSAHQAEQCTRERAEYLARLAHEMRSPLSALTVGLGSLRAAPDANHESVLACMQRNIGRLTKQVTAVLRVERYAEDDVPVHPELIHPAKFVNLCVFDMEEDAAKRSVRLEVRADPNVSASMDPDLLFDTLGNLIRNAVQYTERGTVIVSMSDSDDHIEFQIVDTGSGIDKARQSALFKPVHPSKPGGLGLGLAVAYRAVRAQGGAIGVESEVGAGSTFWFTLPKNVARRD